MSPGFLLSVMSVRPALIPHSFFLAECDFFFNDKANTGIYTLSVHDALPICGMGED